MAGTSTKERRNHIAQQLLLNKRISAKELSEGFGVSTETIRKDLIHLEKNGLAKKKYGGAIVANELLELGFMEKASSHPLEKAIIAQRAAEFADEGAVVFLDAGSTTLEVAKQLALKKNLFVFTNSLHAAQVLTDMRARVCILGGEIKNTSRAAVGGWALKQIGEVRADVAFLGTSGFDGADGPYVESLPESEIKKAMMAASRQSVLVADSSKTGVGAMIKYAEWSDFRAVVTDRNLPEASARAMRDKTEVILA